jgi:HK97 family phage major capsid protein
MNKLQQQVESNFRATFAKYDALCDRVQMRGGQPTDAEETEMRDLSNELSAMEDRLLQLREIEDRRNASIAMMGGSVGADHMPLVRVTSEPELYHKPDAGQEAPVFFRDLLHATVDHDPEARSRIDRHQMMMRAAGTTTTGAGVVPPSWLFSEFAIMVHGSRPWADTLRKVGITDANPVNIGVQQTPGAAVTAQASENTIPNDGSFNAAILTTNPKTYTGKVDVSRQLLDGGNPAIDAIVYADCMGSYNEQIEAAVVAAFEAATGMAATITFPGTAPVYASLPDAMVDGAASVNKHRKMPATVVLMSIGAWAYLLKEKDSNGRPLVTTGASAGPFNSLGQAEATQVPTGVGGQVVGLPVVPSWAGVDNHIYLAKADDNILLESSTFNFRYEEVLGPESIRLGVWGYAAPVIGRYPMSIAQINAGSTIPAPAEGETPTGGSSSKK